MDVRLLPMDGDYGLRGVQAGTVLFQFLPEERGLVIQILEGIYAATECPEARSEIKKILMVVDPSICPDRSVVN
ncbi:MAG: hypothetical protein KBD19_02255 [Candidatus Moranbacteria bacterium]|nr:hypothetical protein [Candidatus Moranbacteria bacterium]